MAWASEGVGGSDRWWERFAPGTREEGKRSLQRGEESSAGREVKRVFCEGVASAHG
jgi:hypothetical protein